MNGDPEIIDGLSERLKLLQAIKEEASSVTSDLEPEKYDSPSPVDVEQVPRPVLARKDPVGLDVRMKTSEQKIATRKLPDGKFFVQFRGMDPQGHFGVFTLIDKKSWKSHADVISYICTKIEKAELKQLDSSNIQGKLVVVMQDGVVYRGIVCEVDYAKRVCRVKEMDDYADLRNVKFKDLFEMPEKVLMVPFKTIYAEFTNMQFFKGTNVVSQAVELANIKVDSVFEAARANGLRVKSGISSLELWNPGNNRKVSDVLLEKVDEIVSFLPQPGTPEAVTLTYFTEEGGVYFQYTPYDYMQHVMKTIEDLSEILNTDLPCAIAQMPEVFDEKYIRERIHEDCGDGYIFAAKYSLDGKWYRAEAKSVDLGKHGAMVRFVDYGNSEFVKFSDMILLEPFDILLSYLPPMATYAVLKKKVIVDEELMDALMESYPEAKIVIEEDDSSALIASVFLAEEGSSEFLPLEKVVKQYKKASAKQ